MNDQTTAKPAPNRRGNVGKCPACGSSVDPDAWRCPTCRTDFCFHCRARLLPADIQLECVAQECAYYGKLICSVCDVAVEREEAPAVYSEPEDGYWPGLLLGVLCLMLVAWYFSSLLIALLLAIVTYVGGGFWLHRIGLNIFGKQREVEQRRRTSSYKCICCGQGVKKLEVTHV